VALRFVDNLKTFIQLPQPLSFAENGNTVEVGALPAVSFNLISTGRRDEDEAEGERRRTNFSLIHFS
jgi:hypothetical protein